MEVTAAIANTLRCTHVRRLDDWPSRLTALLAEREAAPFAWGTNDCCMFAADAIQAMTGIDPARALRGYKTARGAAGRISRGGGVTSIADAGASACGWSRINPCFAARGDIVTVDTDHGVALAVISLDGRRALCPGEIELLYLPVPRTGPAWRIG